ncbi:protein kinase domain-containing protein [Streptomyces bullii]|uniref:non-specific serine/threonine protein kinase n=1 Tax=Streptomyces bullii TaxID=349910 RepID=A0ABW0UXH2_9ACTN
MVTGTEGHNVRVIADRYRLEDRLGRGGMGVVWRATDQLLGRQVAVKELPVDETLSADEARRQRDRTLREARAVAQLHHPHIIVVHDVVVDESDGERPFIVMELIDGGSLADRIATRGPVDAAEAARIGLALLGALGTAHAAGVLHRDLKPANVLLEAGTDRIVLTDFGIAQVAGATTLTETGSFVGSPEYTAPERMSGARTGPESDLWSLGALLCAALSGETPFHRDSLSGVLHAVVFDEIRPPPQAEPLLPVVRGLLERDPDRRLDADTAERMLRAFRDTGRTPQVPPLGHPSTERDAPRRGPSLLRDAAAWRSPMRWAAAVGRPRMRQDDDGGRRPARWAAGGGRSSVRRDAPGERSRMPQDAGAWPPGPQDAAGAWRAGPQGAAGGWRAGQQDAGAWPPGGRDAAGPWSPGAQDAGGWPSTPQDAGGGQSPIGPPGTVTAGQPSEPTDEHSARQSTRGVLVAALLVAAMAGAGVSAAALLMDQDGDRGGTPTSPAPERPPTGTTPAPTPTPTRTPTSSPTTGTPDPAPTSTVTVTHTPSPSRPPTNGR